MGEGEGGKIWENGIETCIVSYKKQIASPGSIQDTGCLGLVHWDDPEGWYGEGEDGMIWENGIETCIISYKKQITSPGLMHDTGCSGLVHWGDPEVWYREGGGRGVHPAFPAHLRMRPVSRGNSRRATWVGPQAERPRFPYPDLRAMTRSPLLASEKHC